MPYTGRVGGSSKPGVFRWAAAVFHEFSKQGTGLEAAQVRNEEAVNRHLRLRCLAQSLLQRGVVTTEELARKMIEVQRRVEVQRRAAG